MTAIQSLTVTFADGTTQTLVPEQVVDSPVAVTVDEVTPAAQKPRRYVPASKSVKAKNRKTLVDKVTQADEKRSITRESPLWLTNRPIKPGDSEEIVQAKYNDLHQTRVALQTHFKRVRGVTLHTRILRVGSAWSLAVWF